MGQYDLPVSPQRAAPVTPTVPIPPEVFKSPGHQGLEDMVDQFIAASRLKAGDQFQIPYPGGVKTFEYLGPESGGRKDWMEKGPAPGAQLTS